MSGLANKSPHVSCELIQKLREFHGCFVNIGRTPPSKAMTPHQTGDNTSAGLFLISPKSYALTSGPTSGPEALGPRAVSMNCLKRSRSSRVPVALKEKKPPCLVPPIFLFQEKLKSQNNHMLWVSFWSGRKSRSSSREVRISWYPLFVEPSPKKPSVEAHLAGPSEVFERLLESWVEMKSARLRTIGLSWQLAGRLPPVSPKRGGRKRGPGPNSVPVFPTFRLAKAPAKKYRSSSDECLLRPTREKNSKNKETLRQMEATRTKGTRAGISGSSPSRQFHVGDSFGGCTDPACAGCKGKPQIHDTYSGVPPQFLPEKKLKLLGVERKQVATTDLGSAGGIGADPGAGNWLSPGARLPTIQRCIPSASDWLTTTKTHPSCPEAAGCSLVCVKMRTPK